MGCDIHIVLEKYDENRDRWVGVRDYALFSVALIDRPKIVEGSYVQFRIKNRNYGFFNDLCGVRGEGSKFGYEPKGLPGDASDLTLLVLDENHGLHSHSWLTMEELKPVLHAYWPEFVSEAVAGKLEGTYAPTVVQRLIDADIGDEYSPERNYRLVFAFDN